MRVHQLRAALAHLPNEAEVEIAVLRSDRRTKDLTVRVVGTADRFATDESPRTFVIETQETTP